MYTVHVLLIGRCVGLCGWSVECSENKSSSGMEEMKSDGKLITEEKHATEE